ncbi:uncharacterized protein LOC113280430 [Papaver somniferum]|uniref:uncharacterized protein LOC113280430 n=1 Tax=Papaver somniferum TaxID=3469 RepID=UPI000E6F85C8|nr:uncharacterized protein LOC113280430 [Papaver somniferum]
MGSNSRCEIPKGQFFWEVKKITNCSTTWAAILDSREQLKKGCIWLVGNGQSINIFSDPWLHTLPGSVPEKLVDGNNEHKKRIDRFIEGVSTFCSICNNDEESIDHLLLHCSFAQDVWFASPLGLRLQGSNQLTLTSLMESLFRANDNNSSLALGMAICWAICKCRNAKVFDQKNMNDHDALTIALYWFNLYHNYIGEEELNGMERNHQTAAVPTNLTWTPPDHPTIKINVDAAWRDGAFACAAVTGDNTGYCHGADTMLERSDSVIFAEATGFQLVVDLALWLNLNNILIEGDSQMVVKTLKGELRKIPWRFWSLKDDITHKMASLNNSGAYSFVPKPANKASHSLATYGLTHNVQHKWTSSIIPAWIASLFVNNS